MTERRTVTASARIVASSREAGLRKVREAFAEFFGDENYVITSESAAADVVLITGEVLTWEISAEAESPA